MVTYGKRAIDKSGEIELMKPFKGKFDTEVYQAIMDLYPVLSDSVESLNELIQENFKILENYYNRVTHNDVVISYLDKIEDALQNNQAINIINELKMKLEGTQSGFHYTHENVIDAVKNIGNASLKIIIILHKESEEEIKKKAYDLHRRKNEAYNDGWYCLGTYGVFFNLRRKIYRLNSLVTGGAISRVDDETLYDTVIDCFNYCALFLVGLEFLDRE